jgi:hypothetical protein
MHKQRKAYIETLDGDFFGHRIGIFSIIQIEFRILNFSKDLKKLQHLNFIL